MIRGSTAIALILTVLASSPARAECAWVLWASPSYDLDDATPMGGYDTRDDQVRLVAAHGTSLPPRHHRPAWAEGEVRRPAYG